MGNMRGPGADSVRATCMEISRKLGVGVSNPDRFYDGRAQGTSPGRGLRLWRPSHNAVRMNSAISASPLPDTFPRVDDTQ